MQAILAEVEPYSVHGTRFYRIVFATADHPDRMTEARVAFEGMYPQPQAGDRVEIRMLLGIIDQVKRIG